MTGDSALRLLVVDDQAVVRLGFTALLGARRRLASLSWQLRRAGG